MMTRLICCGVIALSSLLVPNPKQTALAEDPPTRSLGKPLLRVWFPTTLLQDRQEFLDALGKELNGESEQPQITDPVSVRTESESVRHEGVLVYLDPIGDADPTVTRTHFPGNRWLNPIRFMAVANQEEFEKIVRERTGIDRKVPAGVLEKKDGSFEFATKMQSTIDHLVERRENQTWMFSDYLQHVSRYWRYRGGFMFFGDDELLLTMELPDSTDLKLRGRASERDLFAQIDLDAVTARRKNRFWDAMRKRLEKVLQQHDEEDQIAYAFRKAWGELQLNLIQAVTNDLQSIRLGVEFASAEKPAEITLDLIARPEADLEKYIGKSSLGTRQLAAAIEEPSILTVAVGWDVPLHFDRLLERSIALINQELVTHAGFHADVFIAADELTTALQRSLGGSREFVFKLIRSKQGFTFYGGIRLSEAERVSKSLESLLNSLTTATGVGVIRSRDASGRSYLSYSPSHLSEFVAKSNRERFPGEAHLTVADSTLWFSFGPPDSLDVLSRSLDRSEKLAQNPGRFRVPALLFDIALDRCLSDGTTTKGFDRVPQLALQTLNAKLPGQRTEVSPRFHIPVYPSPNDYGLNDFSGEFQFGIETSSVEPQPDPPPLFIDTIRDLRDAEIAEDEYLFPIINWEEIINGEELSFSLSGDAPGSIDLKK
ncbi:MAG TPA: hypothetical protein VMM56_14815, partial [Planctomycetaceae bacterium]|nr:hypothetical protein [Planctomycetaceae bacterium]